MTVLKTTEGFAAAIRSAAAKRAENFDVRDVWDEAAVRILRRIVVTVVDPGHISVTTGAEGARENIMVSDVLTVPVDLAGDVGTPFAHVEGQINTVHHGVHFIF